MSLDASGVLGLLLNGGHSAKAGYLDGTFRQTGRPAQADEILAAMKSAGYDVRRAAPSKQGRLSPPRAVSPAIVGAYRNLWESMREAVIAAFPKASSDSECSKTRTRKGSGLPPHSSIAWRPPEQSCGRILNHSDGKRNDVFVWGNPTTISLGSLSGSVSRKNRKLCRPEQVN